MAARAGRRLPASLTAGPCPHGLLAIPAAISRRLDKW
jgi:hypothetical protein